MAIVIIHRKRNAMKKLMMLMVAAVVLPVVSFADLPTTVYVVPEGTEGNTPTAPYDTWATAANDIKVAAEQVATHGVVKVLEGTYSSDDGYITERAYELQVVKSTAEDAEPGTVTLGGSLSYSLPEDTDPNHRGILVTKGSIAFSSTAVMMDARRGDNYYKKFANCKLTFSGADAKLDSSSTYLYSGYWSNGSTVRFTNGATGTFARLYMSQDYEGSYSSIFVEDRANVTLSGVCQIGVTGSDDTIFISNATFRASNFNVGAAGATKRNKVILAGEAPIFKSSGTCNLNGDTELHVNLAEMPVAGYADYPIYHTVVNFEETGSITFSGMDELRARLRTAGVRTKTFDKIAIGYAGGQSMNVPDAVLNATNARLAGSGFTLVRNGTCYLNLKFSDPGHDQPIVYLNSANEAPVAPYDTWAKAATTLADAKHFVATNGTLMIAAGTYTDANLAPEESVTVKAVVSPEDDSPGTVTINSTVFPGYTGTNTNALYRKLTLASGIFNTPGTVFVDSVNGGQYASNPSNRLVVTGANTVFSDASRDMYVGYAVKNTQLVVTDGAKCYGNVIYSGRGVAYGEGSTVVVKDGAALSCTTFSQGQQAAGATLIVDNATVSGTSNFTSGNSGTSLGERVIVKGAAPYFSFANVAQFFGNTVLEFDVSDLKLGTVDDHNARLFTATFQMRDDAALRITGVEKLQARHLADESAKARIKYPLIYAWNDLELSDEKFAAAVESANLPEGWALTKESNHVYLTIHKPIGLSVIVR